MDSRSLRAAALAALGTLAFALAAWAQPPPNASYVPAGSGWFCLGAAPGSATAVCDRTRAGCEGLRDQLPWGGLPPSCAPFAGPVSCVTWPTTGNARRTAYRCYRDAAACATARPSHAAQGPSACGPIP